MVRLIQEELNRKQIDITIKGTKVSARILAKAMSFVLQQIKNSKNKPIHGKQTVKQLARQNAGLSAIDIADDGLKKFERYARKYGVDFSAVRIKGSPDKTKIFFKGRDADAVTAAFTEFSKDILSKEKKKPSVRKALRQFKEQTDEKKVDRTKIRERSEPSR